MSNLNKGSPIQLVERHILKGHNLNEATKLCYLSKCLYNYSLYQFRQAFINKEKWLSEFELSKKLSSENQADYRNLPAQTSQQVLKLLVWVQPKAIYNRLKLTSQNL